MKLAFRFNAYLKFSFLRDGARLAKIGYAGASRSAADVRTPAAFMLDEQAIDPASGSPTASSISTSTRS